MNKRGIYRSEIYWADMRSVGISIDHPILIVSNWKGNIKSKYITCLRLTSKEKLNYSATHFELDVKKYGFSKEYSCVLAEEIYTLPKSALKEKICKLDGLDALECDKLLQQHLQLNQDYQYLTHDDILNKFKEENCSITEDELLKLKCECYSLYKESKFEDSVNKCNELLESVKQAKNVQKNDYNYYSNYILSMNHMKLDDYESAIEYINISLTLLPKKDGYDANMAILLWNYSKCLENLNDSRAFDMYINISNYYKKHEFNILSLTCRFNAYYFKGNINEMINVRNELDNLKVSFINTYENDEYKLTMLNEIDKQIEEYSSNKKELI